MRITLIVGMPGSGKTYLAYRLDDNAIVIDDIRSQNELPPPCEHLVITDVNFCDQTIRDKSVAILNERYGNPHIDFVFFENDAEKCRKNVLYRNDGRNVEGTIRRLAPIYQIPQGYKPRTIWVCD